MTGAPDVTVALDDGTSTFAIDVSSRVDLSAGVTLSSFGRTDESPYAQSSSLALTLDNSDGYFTTPQTTTFGSGGFGEGSFGGTSQVIYPGQQIRYTLAKGGTSAQRFTGRLSGINLGWPGGMGELADLAVTANDYLADCERRILRSMVEEEVMLRTPQFYYTLGEPDTSTSAGDTSDNCNDALTMTDVGATGLPVLFGQGTGPGTDGLTTAQFQNGQYLISNVEPNAVSSTTYALGCWFSTTTTPSGLPSNLAAAFGWALRLGTDGKVVADGPGFSGLGGSTVSLVDGDVHFVMVAGDGTYGTLYIDGQYVNSTTVASGQSLFNYVRVGQAFTGYISHVAGWDNGANNLGSGDALDIWNAGHGSAEATYSRFLRLASYGGFTASAPSSVVHNMGPQATSGQSLLSALQTVATAENGFMYADGSGTLVLQLVNYRIQGTPAVTYDSSEIGKDVSVTYDSAQLANQVTITRSGGATQIVIDQPSINQYGPTPASLEVDADTDANAVVIAQWYLTKHKSVDPRIAGVTIDPHSMSDTAAAQVLSTVKIGNRISFTNLPSQAWASLGDLTCEGWSETVSQEAWSLDLNVLPFSLFVSLILDDPVYGALDSYPILY